MTPWNQGASNGMLVEMYYFKILLIIEAYYCYILSLNGRGFQESLQYHVQLSMLLFSIQCLWLVQYTLKFYSPKAKLLISIFLSLFRVHLHANILAKQLRLIPGLVELNLFWAWVAHSPCWLHIRCNKQCTFLHYILSVSRLVLQCIVQVDPSLFW